MSCDSIALTSNSLLSNKNIECDVPWSCTFLSSLHVDRESRDTEEALTAIDNLLCKTLIILMTHLVTYSITRWRAVNVCQLKDTEREVREGEREKHDSDS